MPIIVFDSSTLILLAKIDLLELVTQETDIVITQDVHEEATLKKDLLDAQYIERLVSSEKVRVVAKVNQVSARLLAKEFNLGLGEASTLCLANQNKWLMACDDARAIKTCRALGVPFTTALAFVVRCFEKKLIDKDKALALLERLKNYGWYHPLILEKVRLQLEEGV